MMCNLSTGGVVSSPRKMRLSFQMFAESGSACGTMRAKATPLRWMLALEEHQARGAPGMRNVPQDIKLGCGRLDHGR